MLERVPSIEERLGRKLDQYPTRRDREYGFPAPGTSVKFSYLGSCNYLDIFQYTDAAGVNQYCHEGGALRDIGLDAWFESPKSHEHSEQGLDEIPSQKVLSGGLRLL
jgi:hypothetical protein